jgi:hypothetical protein
MATSTLTTDGLVIDFSDSEVKELMSAEDFATAALPIVGAALSVLGAGVIGAAVVAGIVATINIHKKEFSLANHGNGVEVTLPWWAIAFALWGALLMKPRPPVPPPPPSPDSGKPWTIVQPTPRDAFGDAQSMPSMGTASMFIFSQAAVGSNADGRLEVFAIEKATGRVLHTVQDVPNGSFGDWSQLGDATGVAQIEVISGINGGLMIFAVDTGAGFVWANWQNGPNGSFEGWATVGNKTGFRRVTAGRNADGRLEAFALDAQGVPWHTAQPDPSSGFPDWSQLGDATGVAQIEVISTQSGSLEVFAVDRDAGLAWTIFQDGPNGNWEGWVSIGNKAGLGPIAVGKNADGRLQVFTVQR